MILLGPFSCLIFRFLARSSPRATYTAFVRKYGLGDSKSASRELVSSDEKVFQQSIDPVQNRPEYQGKTSGQVCLISKSEK